MAAHPHAPKAVLHQYLQKTREALLWKLDGLGERDLRLPRTPTGTNLLGIVRHCANVEIGYFGPTFGREWPAPDAPGYVPDTAYDADPQADWWVDADVPASAIVDFYRDVWAFADATIEELPLDATGRVPWWPEESNTVPLHLVLVHVLADLTRHAGHADLLREQADGAAGLRSASTNLPDGVDWPAYVARLEAVADRFPSG
jgi:hypothetical protein